MIQTKIIEQYPDGTMETLKGVYMVKQIQPSCDYDHKTIYVCSTLARAQEYARALNKEYGKHCIFDENWDFVDCEDSVDWDLVHYYTVEFMKINEELAPMYT